MVKVYLDGIFDLFHRGHLEAIKKCLNFGDEVIIGIISDKDATNYKRKPIINEEDRCEIIKNIKCVKNIIFPAPLIITKKFIIDNKIDFIVHGFANEKDYEKQIEFFKIPNEMGIFRKFKYYTKTSTTEIISNIKTNY